MAGRKMIYLDDAIDAVSEGLKHTFVEYRDAAEKMLNKVPSAQPIVFCKDCEYGEKLTDTIRCEYNDYLPFNYNDFCSHGVKRINGGKDE